MMIMSFTTKKPQTKLDRIEIKLAQNGYTVRITTCEETMEGDMHSQYRDYDLVFPDTTRLSKFLSGFLDKVSGNEHGGMYVNPEDLFGENDSVEYETEEQEVDDEQDANAKGAGKRVNSNTKRKR